ncbi:hypothetical protein CQW23_02404 [Capsicum baccatum]|uniref:Uncharacterized protein n=1 Tax=Capsicum baccatum TaxID=33114 RepID=A0A2G2XRQ7_CAPBA|nr:hypothetical protein CQW23_02404 [Capsicum baccatum]
MFRRSGPVSFSGPLGTEEAHGQGKVCLKNLDDDTEAHIKETARSVGSISESEASRSSQSVMALTVSSNFEPRRSRNMSSLIFPTSCYLAFRPDAIFILLRKAYKDSNLGNICRVASWILLKFLEPIKPPEASLSCSEITTLVPGEGSQSEPCTPASFADYSDLFGDEFQIPEYTWDSNFTNVLDIGLVEEGILHVLYACVSQPLLCSKLADNASNFWLALPLVQALLPALRPSINSSDPIDEDVSLWKQPFVQKALAQIVGTLSSSVYRPLLRACAGFLSSFSSSNGRAACVLIDLCSGVFAPWMPQVVAKIDLALDLLEDLLPVIQGARHSFTRARAALKYIVLALSGVMDDILIKYKDAKHQVLFLVEMLEPYLDPAITPVQSAIAFGNVSSVVLEKQEKNCALALNVIQTAAHKPAVLPSLEAEWRRGSVAPSVLLSVLEPHMQLPSDIDLRQPPSAELLEPQLLNVSPLSSVFRNGGASSRSGSHDDSDAKVDSDMTGKVDIPEEVNLLFAPPELNRISLVSGSLEKKCRNLSSDVKKEISHIVEKSTNNQFDNELLSAIDYTVEYSNLHADYFQLMSYRDCQMKASEFRRLALDLHSQCEITSEGHDAAIDALLLAAECYVNPFFMSSSRDSSAIMNKLSTNKPCKNYEVSVLQKLFEEDNDFKIVADLERKRDKFVLEIILEAAELDRKYQQNSDGECTTPYVEGTDGKIDISRKDIKSADAITLLRQNQALICDFLIHRLQKEEHPTHEILLQILLFLLHSGTRLNCSPELIVDTIIKSAEYLNQQLRSFYYQLKEGTVHLNEWKLHAVRRRWILLQRLIIASSGCDEGSELSINYRSGFRFANLLPASAWLQKIPAFSSSASPLARFLGWMAISRNAAQYQKEKLFLVSDLPQLTYLLSIFSDELSVVGCLEQKDDKKIEESGNNSSSRKGGESCSPQNEHQSFSVIYPDISQFFPKLQKEFEVFGESILEAVALQLRFFSPAIVPDLLCWFSDFCSWPFVREENQPFCRRSTGLAKGFVAKNAKAIVLYVLEAIVAEHMEALVPEVPRLMQVLVSLCRSSYCDVSFLSSVLPLVKPIISYSLGKCSANENFVSDDSCLNLESLCFDEIFDIIKEENQSTPREDGLCRAMPIFVLASVFPDLSLQHKVELLQSSISCADFASCEPTTSFLDYLCAYQAVVRNCRGLLLETLRGWGVIPYTTFPSSEMGISAPCDVRSEQQSTFLLDICGSTESDETNIDHNAVVNKKSHLKFVEVGRFLKELEALISKLNPTIERCFMIHHKLAKSLALVSAESFVYSRCLSLVAEKVPVSEGSEEGILLKTESISDFSDFWKISLEGLAEMILVLQENHLWELASVILGSVLAVPQHLSLHSVIGSVCSAVKNFLHGAPSIAWRLHSDQWISLLCERGMHRYHECEGSMIDLFSFMLCHPEPEQRFIALKHLGKLMSQDGHSGSALICSSTHDKVASSVSKSFAREPIISALVSGTWDQVALLASSDPSQRLRIHTMALLVKYVPFSERRNLQSFLAAADTVLQCLTKLSQPTCEGPLAQLSITLFANICLYSPVEDLSLIPENIWSSVESFALGGHERFPVGVEKRTCQALCRLRNEGDEAKEKHIKRGENLARRDQLSLHDMGGKQTEVRRVAGKNWRPTREDSPTKFPVQASDKPVLQNLCYHCDLVQKSPILRTSHTKKHVGEGQLTTVFGDKSPRDSLNAESNTVPSEAPNMRELNVEEDDGPDPASFVIFNKITSPTQLILNNNHSSPGFDRRTYANHGGDRYSRRHKGRIEYERSYKSLKENHRGGISIEDAEPLHIQEQLLAEKEKVSASVRTNMLKLGTLLQADFKAMRKKPWNYFFKWIAPDKQGTRNLQRCDFNSYITRVYAPNYYKERRMVWEEIGSIKGLFKGPWAVCKDFNVARYVSAKRNCTRRTKGTREFSDLVEVMNLIDLQLENASCTWFKRDNQRIASRIDMILIENWWLNTGGVMDRVKEWWSSFDYTGRPYFILASKLKALKHKLKEWSRSRQGNLGQQRMGLLEKLASLESIATDRVLTEDEAVELLEKLASLESIATDRVLTEDEAVEGICSHEI